MYFFQEHQTILIEAMILGARIFESMKNVVKMRLIYLKEQASI